MIDPTMKARLDPRSGAISVPRSKGQVTVVSAPRLVRGTGEERGRGVGKVAGDEVAAGGFGDERSRHCQFLESGTDCVAVNAEARRKRVDSRQGVVGLQPSAPDVDDRRGELKEDGLPPVTFQFDRNVAARFNRPTFILITGT